MWFENFHFLRPLWLLATPLILLPWFLFKSTPNQNRSVWAKHCDPNLLKYLLIEESTSSKNSSSPLLAFSIIALSILGLSGPAFVKKTQLLEQKTDAYVVVLDLSDNILGQDVTPNRLTRAKLKIIDTLNLIEEGSIALVAYAKEAFTVSPLTEDKKTLQYLLQALSPSLMPAKGQSTGEGLLLALNLLENQPNQSGKILLFTASTPDATSIQTARRIREKGIKLQVIGVGKENDAFPKSALKGLADAANGNYLSFQSTDSDFKTHLHSKGFKLDTPSHQSTQIYEEWRDEGYWCLWLLLPLLLGFHRWSLR